MSENTEGPVGTSDSTGVAILLTPQIKLLLVDAYYQVIRILV